MSNKMDWEDESGCMSYENIYSVEEGDEEADVGDRRDNQGEKEEGEEEGDEKIDVEDRREKKGDQQCSQGRLFFGG
jgi:hypothetical protein